MKQLILGVLMIFAWRAAGATTLAQAPPQRPSDKATISAPEEKVKKADKKKTSTTKPMKEPEKKVPVTDPPPRPIPEVEPHVPGQTPPPPPGSPPPHSM